MSLFGNLFSKSSDEESVILVDIGATIVVGAYAHFPKEGAPVLVYEKRVAVEFREGELQEAAVFRALKTVGESLVREGAPVLVRATGSGRAAGVLVSIDAPWQKASVRTEYVEDARPFVFTKRLVNAVLQKSQVKPAGDMIVDESVIGTILNGYETALPYGKEAHRAEIIILTSLIDESMAGGIVSTLRGVFHTRTILPIAGTSLRYQALRTVFPHERDALIIDVTGTVTSIALIRRDLFMSIVQKQSDAASPSVWIDKTMSELAEIARQYPLPRTIFLLAREPEITVLAKAFAGAKLGELWLSDNPPTIVPVLASHLTKLVHQASTATPDILMLLMAIYWAYRDPSIEL